MLEPLLPKGMKVRRPPVWPRRQLIDCLRFRVRTGVSWRDVPVESGPRGPIYDLFRRWHEMAPTAGWLTPEPRPRDRQGSPRSITRARTPGRGTPLNPAARRRPGRDVTGEQFG
ncbi:transposase [Streptomyces lavendulocolor]|uniref:transposase n=1 Tax=Streptomyces lavendulocolor TaxID=67316 RepID=UPI003C3074D3